MTKILLDNKEIKYFIINLDGKIIETGDENPDTWEETFVDMDSIEVGKAPKISYNKSQMQRQGKTPVWSYLNYTVKSIENR